MKALPLTTALTIATSDSGGGAGIQADLKTFAALGVFGLTVLSGVSAQNTQAVTAVESLSPKLVTAQLAALWDDLPVGAIKIGLIGPPENARAIGEFLSQKARHIPLVLDPVLVSTSGHVFLTPAEIEALKNLFPLATLVTPNLPETEILTSLRADSPENIALAAEKLLSLGAQNVLIKGGHRDGPDSNDLLFGPNGLEVMAGPRIMTPNSHGTGCTLSSAIAANLAKGLALSAAVRAGKDYVTGCLKSAPRLGHGSGPLNHFHEYYYWES
jgi:hydroxymethylpyrimidine/phosphomethylpyrimidine kinase